MLDDNKPLKGKNKGKKVDKLGWINRPDKPVKNVRKQDS